MLTVHEIGIEFHAGFVIFVGFFKGNLKFLSLSFDQESEVLFGHVIKYILNFVSVYGNKDISRLYAAFVGRGVLLNPGNFYRHVIPPKKERAVSVCHPKTAHDLEILVQQNGRIKYTRITAFLRNQSTLMT